MSAIPAARRRTTLVLKGKPLPLAFQEATIAAACNAYARTSRSATAQRRRLAGKVEKLDAIELGEVRR